MDERRTTAQDVIRLWKDVAGGRGYTLNGRHSKKFNQPYYEILAHSVANVTRGACPCLPQERPACPCSEMDDDIKKTGCCFCKLFLDPNWGGEYGVVKGG